MDIESDLYQDGESFVLVVTYGDEEDRIVLSADNFLDAAIEADQWIGKFKSLYGIS